MAVLAQASLVYVDPVLNPDVNLSSWVESTQLAADCTWERGLLVKGLMLCHGENDEFKNFISSTHSHTRKYGLNHN
jgi:hypothetical protein